MKTKILFLWMLPLFFACANVHAQVTIGGLEKPAKGALLDLNSTSKGGLLLSNVTITNPDSIPYGTNLFPGINKNSADINIGLRGAMVYNDGQEPTVPAGIYVWNGYYWTPDGNCRPIITASSSSPVSVDAGNSTTLRINVLGCPPLSYKWFENTAASTIGGVFTDNTDATYDTPTDLAGKSIHYYYCEVSSSSGKATSDVFTVNVAFNPAALPHGIGAFTGKTGFDLAQGNDGSSNCGPRSGRVATDFSNRTPQDGAGTIPYSGVQVYTFTPSKSVSRVRFEYVETSGSSIDHIEHADYSGNNISGKCKVTVYYKETLNTTLLGSTRNTGHKLKLYAIYNSEATYSTPGNDRMLDLSISLQDCNCCGAYTNASHTQWLNFMCHNLGADESADPLTPAAAIHGAKYKWGVATATLTQTNDQTYYSGFSDWASRTPPPTGYINWNIDANPCPTGWRVPNKNEWDAVTNASNNTLTWQGLWLIGYSNFSAGLKIGDALLLPAAGARDKDDGELLGRGNNSVYWRSDGDSQNDGYYIFTNEDSDIQTDVRVNRSTACSVRCVAD
jgi:uncharacterized protein (TIGR02145 family)